MRPMIFDNLNYVLNMHLETAIFLINRIMLISFSLNIQHKPVHNAKMVMTEKYSHSASTQKKTHYQAESEIGVGEVVDDFHIPSREEINSLVEKMEVEYGVSDKRIMRKTYFWIIIPCFLVFLIQFLDVVNVSNANAYDFGAKPDPSVSRYMRGLGLVGKDFNIGIGLFYTAYTIFDVPNNFCTERLKPHIWLPALIFVFGGGNNSPRLRDKQEWLLRGKICPRDD